MKQWCRINLYVQITIILLAVLSLPFISIYALILLLPFGAWQIISSLVFAIQFRKIEKQNKRLFKLYWAILAVLAILYFNDLTGLVKIDGVNMIYSVFSIGLGVYYLVISSKMLNNRIVRKTSFLPNILDQF